MRKVYLPATLSELWSLLDDHTGALLFAGGTDLFVKMRAGKMDTGTLIGLERIATLKEVREEQNEILIGACVTHAQLMNHRLIAGHLPMLRQALQSLGSPPIRNMGTIGGNVCTASPAGDTLPPLYVLEAHVELASSSGVRVMPIKDFIAGPGKTQLQTAEILTAIRLRKPAEASLQHFEKVGQRKSMACAVASMAALIGLSSSGVVERCHLAWGSVGPTVLTDQAIEELLTGRKLTYSTLVSCAGRIQQTVEPIDDIRASADYRRRVSANLLLRLAAHPLLK